MSEKLTTINYNEMDFVWIQNHWDIHLSGLCNYKGDLCEFKTIVGQWEWDDESEECKIIIPTVCEIFSLTKKEKREWLRTKRRFELFVGYHWTYPYRKTRSKPFGSRKPRWFFALLCYFYYRLKLNNCK